MLMGWVIAYFFKTLTAQYFGMSAEQIGELFNSFAARSAEVFLWQIAICVGLGIIVSRGLVKGIETFTKIAMPILFLILLGLALYSLTLPGALEGLDF